MNFYADRNGNEVGFLATYEIADGKCYNEMLIFGWYFYFVLKA